MKVKSKPDGYPARRRAIQNVKDQFYFLFDKSSAGRRPERPPLWGIALAFFVLFQSCENRPDGTQGGNISSSVVHSIGANPDPRNDAGALLLHPVEYGRHGFSSDYLTQGYKDDLYLRDQLSNYGTAASPGLSGQNAVSENTMVE